VIAEVLEIAPEERVSVRLVVEMGIESRQDSAISVKRQRIPDILDVKEIKELLGELQEPVKTMVLLAASTGLRVSELIGLKWYDFDFDALEISLSRSVVDGVVGMMKTEASRKPVPLDPGLSEVLLEWRRRSPYRVQDDWCFASPRMNGLKPYSPDTILAKAVRSASPNEPDGTHSVTLSGRY
jgi:integrase